MIEQEKKTHWLYFAYGSNMNPNQIHARCTHPEFVALAKLPDHEVNFFGNSRVWDGAQETVIPSPGKIVYGVIYKLTKSDWDRLDSWQDVRLDGTGAYFHFPTIIEDLTGKKHFVLTYKKCYQGESQLPSKEYLDLIIQAAIFHDLPIDCLERWKTMQYKNASYPVPRQSLFNRSLLLDLSCTGCESEHPTTMSQEA